MLFLGLWIFADPDTHAKKRKQKIGPRPISQKDFDWHAYFIKENTWCRHRSSCTFVGTVLKTQGVRILYTHLKFQSMFFAALAGPGPDSRKHFETAVEAHKKSLVSLVSPDFPMIMESNCVRAKNFCTLC